MLIVIVLIIYLAAVLLDLLPTLKTKKPNIIWPCIIILGLGAAVQLMYEMKVNVPSPSMPITDFVASLFDIK